MMARRHSTEDTGSDALRRPGFIIAGLVVALALIGAVVVLLASPDDKGSGPPGSPPVGAPSGNAPAPDAQCRPTDTDQTIPQTPPTGVTWSLLRSVAIPSSPTAGPMIVKDGVARCYAHTPVGALIASRQIGVRSGLSPQWRTVIERQLMPGPGRDTLLKAMATFTPSDQPGAYAQTAGFRFVSFSPQIAVIDIASRSPDDGALGTGTTTLLWDGGDWKIQPTTQGTTITPVQPLASLDGYVPWGGV